MGLLGFRWLVNFGLLAIPIATTLGILIGLQSHRDATGQAPLFKGDGGDDGTGDGSNVDKNGVQYIRNCDKAYGITPDSKGLEYTLNPNQWGVEDGDTGFLCMNVTTFNNGSYATDTTAPEFFVSWQYEQGPATQPVHAFPNIKVDGKVFPVTMGSVSKIDVDVEWTYGVGNDTLAASTDEAALTANSVNTNVAIDMFLDSDKDSAEDSSKAKYEVMVWLAAFGAATQPIGLSAGAVTTATVNGTTFSLYTGQNSLDQYVLTWYADSTTENFHGDIAPLITKLTTLSGNYPSETDYLGYMGLGSEALYATKPTTFYVSQLSIDIETSS